uniref:Uncharacterized protein n=1 Tax=Anopheles atroparvus TaxID=41427 RepID=A0AAG5DW89_ANOAO
MALPRSVINLMKMIGCDLACLLRIIYGIWRCIVQKLVKMQSTSSCNNCSRTYLL